MRKKIQIQIVDDGTPLTFEITQWSVTQKDEWINKAAILLAGNAGNINGNIGTINNAIDEMGANFLSLFTGLEYEKVQPLLEKLQMCCAKVDGNARQVCSQAVIDGFISDIKTLWQLRVEAFKLNFPDFFTMMKSMGENNENKSELKGAILKMPRNS